MCISAGVSGIEAVEEFFDSMWSSMLPMRLPALKDITVSSLVLSSDLVVVIRALVVLDISPALISVVP